MEKYEVKDIESLWIYQGKSTIYKIRFKDNHKLTELAYSLNSVSRQVEVKYYKTLEENYSIKANVPKEPTPPSH